MSSLISSIGISFGEVCASLAVGIIAATWVKASMDEGHRQALLSKCEETADEAQNRICILALQNLKQGNARLGKSNTGLASSHLGTAAKAESMGG